MEWMHVNDINYSLEVVSFTSNYLTKQVCNYLSKLNYSFITGNPAKYIAEECSPNRENTFVFLLDSNLPRELIVFLTKNYRSYLVVFCSPISECDPRIMQLSVNFCAWPCHEHELDMRLKHILSKSKDNISEYSEYFTDDQWADLNLVGNCSAFLKIKSLIQKSAQCHAPILIEGETGTGKEGVARAIHYLSDRKEQPFIAVNCGALPDTLVENELFGHARGAYTDAKQQQLGLIDQASGGTIFFDEIECLSLKGQASLLRFTENQEYKALGGKDTKKADVRIITASNAPLSKLTTKGRFRQDLLFRLNLITLKLPALRERGKDIELLSEYFMQQYRSYYNQTDKYIDRQTLNWMRKYSWPGNIRELENFIHRLFLLNEEFAAGTENNSTDYDVDTERRNGLERRQEIINDTSFKVAKGKLIACFEERYLETLLTQTQGNVTHAADLASMERRALGKLLKKHGINKEKYKSH